MDSGNDIRATVFDADGSAVVDLLSENVSSRESRVPRVTVSRPDGRVIGVAHHRENVVFTDGAGAPVASVDVEADGPWQLAGAAGAPLGVIARVPAQPVEGPSLLDYAVGMNTITDDAADFAATMFRGFAFSNVYSVALPALPAAEPLRTLAVLSPVIFGHLY